MVQYPREMIQESESTLFWRDRRPAEPEAEPGSRECELSSAQYVRRIALMKERRTQPATGGLR